MTTIHKLSPSKLWFFYWGPFIVFFVVCSFDFNIKYIMKFLLSFYNYCLQKGV